MYAQMIAGRDAPTHGEAKNSWLTGTAAWNYYAITQWILGIRPEYDGLRIAPVLRSAGGLRAVRRFRGVTYRIAVRREGPGNGVKLDGGRQAGGGRRGSAAAGWSDGGEGRSSERWAERAKTGRRLPTAYVDYTSVGRPRLGESSRCTSCSGGRTR